MFARCIDVRQYMRRRDDGVYVVDVSSDRDFGICFDLTLNKVYEVLEFDDRDFRIVDDSGEDYLYPRCMFELVAGFDELDVDGEAGG